MVGIRANPRGLSTIFPFVQPLGALNAPPTPLHVADGPVFMPAVEAML